MPIKKKTRSFDLASKLTFGKYKGLRVSDVLRHDPRYINWAKRNIPWFKLRKEAIVQLKLQLVNLPKKEAKPFYNTNNNTYWGRAIEEDAESWIM